MGAYKQVQQEGTVGDLVADAVSELESLRDEMSEWRDNMEGTGLESTGKYEAVSEAADTLESYVDEIDVPVEVAALKVVWFESVNRNKRRGASRAVRLSNACSMLAAVAERLGESPADGEVDHVAAAEDLVTEIEELKDNVESIEFPGMF